MDSMISRIFRDEFRSGGSCEAETRIFIRRNQDLLELLDKMDGDLRERFLAVVKEQHLEHEQACSEFFAEGFCMGAKLMIEVLTAI